MAASKSTTAKNLGPMPKVGGEIQKPLRKLETAKVPAVVLNPVLSKEASALLSSALARFADKAVPEPPLDDLRAMRKAKEKAIKEKEVVKATTKPPPPKPKVATVNEVSITLAEGKRPKGMSKKKWRKLKSKVASAPVAHSANPERMEELRVKHAELLSKYQRKPMEIPELPSFPHVGKAELVFKEEPPAHEDEGEVIVLDGPPVNPDGTLNPRGKWARKVIVKVPAGPVMRTKVITEFEDVTVSEAQLAWYELNTPILNSMGGVMATDLLYHDHEGKILTPHVLQVVKEPEPLCIGKVQVGVRFVTKQVLVPQEFGEEGYSRVASARRTQSQRSERGRIERGYPRNSGGPVGLSIARTAPIVKMEAANDPPPWDDDVQPPPTAVVGDIGFMESVYRRRLIRQKYAQSKHSVWRLSLPPHPLAQLKLAEQTLPGLRAMRAVVKAAEWDNRKLKGSRIRRQFSASMSEPNFHWGEHLEFNVRPNGRNHVVGEIVTPTDHPKQPTVEVATRNTRAPRLLDNIQWGNLSAAAKRKFVDFMMVAACPDREGIRLQQHTLRTRKISDLTETTQKIWSTLFTRDRRRMFADRKETKRYRQWLKDAALVGDSSNDEAHFDRHPKHAVTDDSSLQEWMKAKERENPSTLYWDSCDSCHARAKSAQLCNVYSLKERRQLTVKERNILIGETEERLDEAKGQAEDAVATSLVLSKAQSSSIPKDMTPEEKDVYVKALVRADVPDTEIRKLPSWRKLKDRFPNMGMVNSMFTHWVTGEGNLILPPKLT